MDPLVSLILHNNPITFNNKQEFLKTLERAESNRVLYLFLEKMSKQTKDKIILKKYAEMKNEKREYEKGARDLLQKLMEAKVKFLVIKTARYSHVSFDIDLLFKTPADFEKSISMLTKSTIRPDPHASGLREYKGATIVLPAEEPWKRKEKKKLHGVEVYVPSEEDSAIIFLLHMIKHREIFIGDLISLTNLKVNESVFQELIAHYRLRIIAHFVTKLLNNLGIFNKHYEAKFPILDSLVNLLAEKKSKERFPLKLPKLILYLTSLKLI